MALRLFLLQPTVIFRGRINMASVVYPLDTLVFDGVTVGSYSAIEPGMTLVVGSASGLDDKGRQRVRAAATATTIPVGRSSRGTRDGELDIADNDWVEVWLDYRVWAKIPYIAGDGTQYKDSAIAVGTSTSGDEPPVANAGAPALGTIDSVSGVFRTWLPHVANSSFAVADGATIASYAWVIPSGVTLVAGSALTDSAIQVDCDPGHYWISLTVTDSNGNTHTARTWVLARDPDADACINAFEITSHRWMRQGQLLSVRVLEDIPATTYLDGTLVAVMDGEPSSGIDRSNILFWGWHQSDPAEIGATRTGTLAGTVLDCVDVAGRLDSLPGFSMVVYNDAKRDTTANPAITWAYMTTPHVDKLLHYLLHWHSTALEVADFTWSGTTTTFPFTVLECGGESLFDQVNRKAQALMPDRYFVCDRLGRLAVRVDPLLQDAADRTATVQATVDVDHWQQLRYTAQRPPRVHWLEGSAIQAHATTVTALFCKAPGEAPGQGEQGQTHGEQLAPSQAVLNAVTGHRYARLNAPYSHFRITAAGYDYTLVDPAAMTWVNVTLSTAAAAQRGAPFLLARGLVHEMVIRYEHRREGTVRTAELLWERETSGTPAVTVVPADAEPVDDGNDYWYTPPLYPPPDEGRIAGQNVVAVFSRNGKVYRTSNFQNASPTWDEKDLGISGTSDFTYTFVVDPFSPGYIDTVGGSVDGWIATEDYLYRVEDIFGTTPTATAVVTFAEPANWTANKEWRTVKASFGEYFAEGDNPWVMCVSYYGGTSLGPFHATREGTYATYSVDGGQTWSAEIAIADQTKQLTPLDQWPIGLYLSPKTPGLAYVFAFDRPVPDDDPPYNWVIVECYKTTDWGATWSVVTDPNMDAGWSVGGDIHVPWPANDDEGVIYHGGVDSTAYRQLRLYRTNGANRDDISPADGDRTYGVNTSVFAVRTYDNDRRYVAVAGVGNDALDGDPANDMYSAFVSNDYGETWTQITTPAGLTAAHPESIAFAADSPDVLFLWGMNAYVAYSSDFGATVSSKAGNIDSFGGAQDLVGLAGGPLT